MEFHSNISTNIERLKQVRDAIATGSANGNGIDFSDAMFSALNTGMGAMKNRIFNQSRDANGDNLGKYIGSTTHVTDRRHRILKYGDTDAEKKEKKRLRKNLKEDAVEDQRYTEYEKKRIAHGRQIAAKDLEFYGSLRRSIEIVKDHNKATIVFVNPENALIAKYQEQQIGNIRATGFGKGNAAPAVIFALSKEEYDLVIEQASLLVIQVVQKFLRFG